MKGTRYISEQEIARRWGAVRQEMERAGAGALVAFSSPQLMARGLLRWLTDWLLEHFSRSESTGLP